MFYMTFDGALGLCPMNSKEKKVKRVLDVGTGTGIWVIDFGICLFPTSLKEIVINGYLIADEHPEAEVHAFLFIAELPC
jgi:hypothetical protein